MLVNGASLPDWETHLGRWLEEGPVINGKPTYQWVKMEPSLKQCRAGNCIDVGAHCGLWAMHLIDYFDHVYAFEPVAEHREHFLINVPERFTLYEFACGDKSGTTSTHTVPGESGNTWLVEGDDIEVRRIDDFDLENIAFIKVDCEGYEYFALKGAEETILRDKPTILVEQKPQNKKRYGLEDLAAVKYLQGLGMKNIWSRSGDYLMVWG